LLPVASYTGSVLFCFSFNINVFPFNIDKILYAVGISQWASWFSNPADPDGRILCLGKGFSITLQLFIASTGTHHSVQFVQES